MISAMTYPRVNASPIKNEIMTKMPEDAPRCAAAGRPGRRGNYDYNDSEDHNQHNPNHRKSDMQQ